MLISGVRQRDAVYIYTYLFIFRDFTGSVVKSLPGNVRDMRHRLDSWVGKIPWRRAW